MRTHFRCSANQNRDSKRDRQAGSILGQPYRYVECRLQIFNSKQREIHFTSGMASNIFRQATPGALQANQCINALPLAIIVPLAVPWNNHTLVSSTFTRRIALPAGTCFLRKLHHCQTAAAWERGENGNIGPDSGLDLEPGIRAQFQARNPDPILGPESGPDFGTGIRDRFPARPIYELYGGPNLKPGIRA